MLFQHEIFIGILTILPLITIIPIFLFLLIFLKDFYQTKQKMFKFLSLLFAVFLLQHFFQVSQYLIREQEIAQSNFIIYQIFNMLTLYILVIVLEMFERNSLTSNRHTLLSIITFIVIGGMISSPSLEIQPIGEIFFVRLEPFTTIMFLRFSFNLIASIWLILMLFKSRKVANSQIQKNLLTWLFIGIFFAIFLPSFPIFFWDFFSPDLLLVIMERFIIGIIFQNIGILIIGVAFFKVSKKPWLLQRQKVHFLLVYSKIGVELYSKSFYGGLTTEDTILLAGGFSAISSLIQEATKTSGEINAIILEGKELRIKSRPNFLCALLVDYSTQASEEAHEKFMKDFEEQFNNALENFSGEITPFQKAEEITKRCFT